MAKMMKHTFGTRLFYFKDDELKNLKSLPSPDDLKNKILIKVFKKQFYNFMILTLVLQLKSRKKHVEKANNNGKLSDNDSDEDSDEEEKEKQTKKTGKV